MRVDEVLGRAEKEVPSEVVEPTLVALHRGGFVRWTALGPAWLPLGWAVHQKVAARMIEVAERWGASAVRMPGEDVVEGLVAVGRSDLRSWRQLPALVWQEGRSEGGRQLDALQRWTLDVARLGGEPDDGALWDHLVEALPVQTTEVLSAPLFGDGRVRVAGTEGAFLHFLCPSCGQAGAPAVFEVQPVEVGPSVEGELERVHTPEARTIAALADFLGITEAETAKAVLLEDGRGRVVFVVVRGDLGIDRRAVERAVGWGPLVPAAAEHLKAVGIVPGFASPVGIARKRVKVVADRSVVREAGLVSGANEVDVHLLNVAYGRDWTADIVADVAEVTPERRCRCGSPIEVCRGTVVLEGVEHGTGPSEGMEATFLDVNGKARPHHASAYRVFVGACVTSVARANRDDDGVAWPTDLAPLDVQVLVFGKKAVVREAGEAVVEQLEHAGLSVLFDDRKKLSPGAKLAEADLRGLPFRVVVSERRLADGLVEVKPRQGEAFTVSLEALVEDLRNRVEGAVS